MNVYDYVSCMHGGARMDVFNITCKACVIKRRS